MLNKEKGARLKTCCSQKMYRLYLNSTRQLKILLYKIVYFIFYFLHVISFEISTSNYNHNYYTIQRQYPVAVPCKSTPLKHMIESHAYALIYIHSNVRVQIFFFENIY